MSRRVRILIQPSKELPCLLNYFLFFWRGLHIFIILTFRRGAWCLVLDAPALRVVVVGTTLVGGSNDAVRRMIGRPRPTTTVLRVAISSHLATRPSKVPSFFQLLFYLESLFHNYPPCYVYIAHVLSIQRSAIAEKNTVQNHECSSEHGKKMLVLAWETWMPIISLPKEKQMPNNYLNSFAKCGSKFKPIFLVAGWISIYICRTERILTQTKRWLETSLSPKGV